MIPERIIFVSRGITVILARKRQLPDDDRMIETCQSIFKSFNVNNLSVCIGWCADQVIRQDISRCDSQPTLAERSAASPVESGPNQIRVRVAVPVKFAVCSLVSEIFKREDRSESLVQR